FRPASAHHLAQAALAAPPPPQRRSARTLDPECVPAERPSAAPRSASAAGPEDTALRAEQCPRCVAVGRVAMLSSLWRGLFQESQAHPDGDSVSPAQAPKPPLQDPRNLRCPAPPADRSIASAHCPAVSPAAV